jgi:hypothetical protein
MKRIATLAVLMSVFSAAAESPDMFIDFVANNGTSYFDTGVIGKTFTKVEIDFQAEQFPTHGTYIMGAESSFNISPWYYNYGNGLYYYNLLINSNPYAQVGVRYNVRSVIEQGLQTIDYLDLTTGESLIQYGPNDAKPHSTYSGSTELPMYLFAVNRKGSPVISDGRIKLFGLKIYQKNSAQEEYTLLRNYKPAIKNDRVCLYDEVQNNIIYPKNANGEDGVIGPSFIKVFATEQNSKSPIEQLVEAVRTAPDNSIITIERGTYRFPDDVYMADNTLSPTSESYCKIRLNVTQNGLIIRGEDSSSRRTWELGREPVIIDGNGGKAIQFQLEATGSARVENIAFVNCDGGAYGSNNESLYGNWCNGGAIGIGKLVVNKWNGGENVVVSNCVFRDNRSAMGGAIGGKNNYFVQDSLFTNNVPDRYSGCMYFGSAYGCDFIKNVTPVQQVDVVDNCTFVS